MLELDRKLMSEKFIKDLSAYLSDSKLDHAVDLINDESHEDTIKESSWEIVPIVSSYLTLEKVNNNRALLDCCEVILTAIVEKCNPLETILELLEQIECSDDDTKFCVILKVLGKTLSRMRDKNKVIEWCTSTIRSYIESLAVPHIDNATADENETNEIKMASLRIIHVYTTIIGFLEPLVKEAVISTTNCEESGVLRDYLLSILIYLLGKPICYLHKDVLRPVEFQTSLTEKITIMISHLTGDLLQFLHIINKRNNRNIPKKLLLENRDGNRDLKTILFDVTENLPNLAYANFYYYVITTECLWDNVPQVYDLCYIFQTCLFLIKTLLEENKVILVARGLDFMDHILQWMNRRSIDSDVLELSIYSEIFDGITRIMIFCDSDKQRKNALRLFHEYIEIFSLQARYFIITHLYETCEFSGLLSLVTNLLKASVIECLETTPPDPHFLGNNLHSLLRRACKLPHGSASDIVELSDEIITALNLLRFLFIKDMRNVTGVWNMADQLEQEYLKPLREGIDLCRAHWQVKRKDLEEQKKACNKQHDNVQLEKSNAQITLMVGAGELPPMPIKEKIRFCHQTINGLDVMESILIRVNECIIKNPLKSEA